MAKKLASKRNRRAKPFKISKRMPKPLTFDEMVKKYGLTPKEAKEVLEIIRFTARHYKNL